MIVIFNFPDTLPDGILISSLHSIIPPLFIQLIEIDLQSYIETDTFD